MKLFRYGSLRSHLLVLSFFALFPFVVWVVHSQWVQYRVQVSNLRSETLRTTENLAADHAADVNAARALLIALGNLSVLNSDRETCDRFLDNIRRQHSLYANLAVVRADGSLQCSADKPLASVNFADRRWFKEVMAHPSQLAGEYLMGRITGKPVFALARPILDRDERVTHIILASISLRWFEEHYAITHLPEGSVMLLLDQDGTVLLHSRGELKYVGQPIKDSSLQSLLEIRSATAVDLSGLDGVQRLYTATPIGGAEKPAAFLAIGIPSATLYAPAWRSLWVSAAILGALLLIVVLVMIAANRFMVVPLQALARAARRLGDGDASTALPTQAVGEVGELAREFARMVDLVEEREHTLRTSRHLLAESQRAAHIGSWSMNLDSKKIAWSDEAFRLFGLDPQSETPDLEAILNLVHPDDRAMVRQWITDCIAGREPSALEFRAMRPNGEVRMHYGQGVLRRDDQGEAAELIGTVQDLTDRRDAETALRESEALFRTAITAMAEGVVVQDRNDAVLTCNDAAQCILGLTHDQLLGRSSFDPRWRAIHEDNSPFDPAKHPSVVAMRTGQSQRNVIMGVHKPDGSLTWISINSQPLLNPGENLPYGTVTTFHDVTERKLAELALRDNEQRFRSVIDASPVPYALNDDAGNITYLNPAFTRLFGYTRDDIPTLVDWWPKAYPDLSYRNWIIEEWGRRMMQARQSGRAFEPVELAIRCKDGAMKTIVASAASLAESFSGSHLVVLFDITERKAAEHERERLSQQLQQAQKMQALGQLTGGIAHDFNNVLASILGYTELALGRRALDQTGKLAEYLEQVKQAGNRARDLIASLLVFSRGGGKGSSERKPVDAVALVNEVQNLLTSVLPSSIRLVNRFEKDLPRVYLNPVALHQIIFNLCINARDALGGRGEITIGVSAANAVSSQCDSCHAPVVGNFVALTIQDNGVGIAPENLSRIFEPFFTTKGVGRGTGMGLSIVHGLIHEHGGHIQVQSQLGMGTSVTVWLQPCVAANETVPAAAKTVLPVSSGSGESVLVVDDDASVAMMLGEALDYRGFRSHVFTDSRAALAAFLAAPDNFAAVIADQTMPNLTGIELVQALREIRPKLPVILCTGHSDQIDEAGAKMRGIDRYFMKPVALSALMQAVHELLERPS